MIGLFSVGGNLRGNDELSMQIFNGTKMTLLSLFSSSSSAEHHTHTHTRCVVFFFFFFQRLTPVHILARRKKNCKVLVLSIRAPIINGYEAPVTAPIIIIYTMHTHTHTRMVAGSMGIDAPFFLGCYLAGRCLFVRVVHSRRT